MYFGLHTTKKAERDALLERNSFVDIEVRPFEIHGKGNHLPIVIDEDTKEAYVHNIDAFLQTLKLLEQGQTDVSNSPYYTKWKHKGDEVITRLRHLPALFSDIKRYGVFKPIDVEITGERLDGSFRSKIAMFLGIPVVKARLHQFRWQDIDEDFIERKLKARQLSSGKDYYEFEYGYKDWKNILEGGEVYRENALERWKAIEPYVKGDVLDIGCNEGYMSLQAALKGCNVVGVDHDWKHIAYLNKLIFEWINKKDLNCKFIEADLNKCKIDGVYNTVLLLNVIYHLDRSIQISLLKDLSGTIIIQCNLRKEAERQKYYGSHPDDIKELLKQAGKKVIKEINFKDKPIIIAI